MNIQFLSIAFFIISNVQSVVGMELETKSSRPTTPIENIRHSYEDKNVVPNDTLRMNDESVKLIEQVGLPGKEEVVVSEKNNDIAKLSTLALLTTNPTNKIEATVEKIEITKEIVEVKKVEKVRDELQIKKDEALFKAVEEYKDEKDLDLVRQLLQSGADVNALHEHPRFAFMHVRSGKKYDFFRPITVLHRAICNESLKLLELLFEYNANVHVERTLNGDTPLYIAAERGFVEGVRLLIARGAQVEKGGGGKSPLYGASREGRTEVVRLLIEQGANIRTTYNAKMPIHEAAEYGHIEVIKQFLDVGMSANVVNDSGKTSLHYAMENTYNFDHGRVKTTQFLVDNGANINVQDNKGNTPLHYAAEKDIFDVGSLLVQLGAQLNIVNKKNKTPLDVAVLSGSIGMVQFLQKKGGSTCACGSKSNDELLQDAYLLALSKKETVETLLTKAIQHKDIDTFRFLLTKGIDINKIIKKDYYTCTYLFEAVQERAYDIAKVLLQHGADLNLKPCERTPLRRAVECHDYDMVVLLLKGTIDYRLSKLHVGKEENSENCLCSEHKKNAIALLQQLIPKDIYTLAYHKEINADIISQSRMERFEQACIKNNIIESLELDDVITEFIRRSIVGKEGEEFKEWNYRLNIATLLHPLNTEKTYETLYLGVTKEDSKYDHIFALVDSTDDSWLPVSDEKKEIDEVSEHKNAEHIDDESNKDDNQSLVSDERKSDKQLVPYDPSKKDEHTTVLHNKPVTSNQMQTYKQRIAQFLTPTRRDIAIVFLVLAVQEMYGYITRTI